jgi:hypothetical protein
MSLHIAKVTEIECYGKAYLLHYVGILKIFHIQGFRVCNSIKMFFWTWVWTPICNMQLKLEISIIIGTCGLSSWSYTYIWVVPIRYVGVIWFISHVLQLMPIIITQPNLCCSRKSTMKHLQKKKTYWKSDLPCLIMVIRSACLLIS